MVQTCRVRRNSLLQHRRMTCSVLFREVAVSSEIHTHWVVSMPDDYGARGTLGVQAHCRNKAACRREIWYDDLSCQMHSGAIMVST